MKNNGTWKLAIFESAEGRARRGSSSNHGKTHAAAPLLQLLLFHNIKLGWRISMTTTSCVQEPFSWDSSLPCFQQPPMLHPLHSSIALVFKPHSFSCFCYTHSCRYTLSADDNNDAMMMTIVSMLTKSHWHRLW